MHVVILGGGGFLGSRLAKKLLEGSGQVQEEITQLTVVDIAFFKDDPKDSFRGPSSVDYPGLCR